MKNWWNPPKKPQIFLRKSKLLNSTNGVEPIRGDANTCEYYLQKNLIQPLNIAKNGHIGFNEPSKILFPDCHITDLSASSLKHPMVNKMKSKPTL